MSLLGLTLMLMSRTIQNSSETRTCQEKGYPAYYHLDRRTNECHRIGEVGPCIGKSMIFYAEGKDSLFGLCDCDFWLGCWRPFIYWQPLDSCFPINSQGPCQPGDWLTYDLQKGVSCESNSCPGNNTEAAFFTTWPDGQCYSEGQQGPCPPNFYMYTNVGETQPACRRTKMCITSWAPTVTCSPGHKSYHLDVCSKQREHHSNSRCDHGSQWDSFTKRCVLSQIVK